MGIVEVVVILLNIAFAVMLLVVVPIGWAAWADPSRGAKERIAGARVALARHQEEQARRLLVGALSLPRRARYSPRQARTTREALGLLAQIAPEDARLYIRLQAEIPADGGSVGTDVVDAVRDRLALG